MTTNPNDLTCKNCGQLIRRVNVGQGWWMHTASRLVVCALVAEPAVTTNPPTDDELIRLSDGDLQACYPEVEAFAVRMRAELLSNSGKGDQEGWRSMSLRQAWGEIAWHNAKMATAIKAEDWPLVRELAADVANGAMMLDDIVRIALGEPQPFAAGRVSGTPTPEDTRLAKAVERIKQYQANGFIRSELRGDMYVILDAVAALTGTQETYEVREHKHAPGAYMAFPRPAQPQTPNTERPEA